MLACAKMGTWWPKNPQASEPWEHLPRDTPTVGCLEAHGQAGLMGAGGQSKTRGQGGRLSPGRATPELLGSESQQAPAKVWGFISFWVNKSIFNKTLSF